MKLYFNFLNMLSLWFSMFIIVNIKAQNTEHAYIDYTSWGFTLGINRFDKGSSIPNKPNTKASFKQMGTSDYTVGVNYNHIINSNISFELAVKAQLFGDIKYAQFDSRKQPGKVGSSTSFILSIPLTAYYTFEFSNYLKIDVGSGIGLAIYQYQSISTTGIGDMYGDAYVILEESNNINPYYPTAHVEIGFGIEMGKVLLQPKLMYSKSFKAYRKGNFQFSDLTDEPNFGGIFEQSGNFIGFYLGIRFKKKNHGI